MKNLCGKAALTAAAVAFAASASTANAQELLAFWGFDAREGSVPQFVSPLAPDLGEVPTASLSWNFLSSGNTGVNSFTGTDINWPSGYTADPNYDMAIQGLEDDGNYLNDGRHWTIAVDTTGYENISLKMAIQRSATGFTNNTIEYSTDGGGSWNLFEAGFNPPTSRQLRTFNFGEYANDEPDFQVRMTLDGADANAGNNRFDNITIEGTEAGTGPLPVNVDIATAYTSNFAGDEVVVRFNTPPGEEPEAGDFSLDDAAGVSITDVQEIAGEPNSYLLTLSGPASGDTTLDTLVFDNLFDNPDTIAFFAGVMDIETIRGTVDTDGDWTSTLEVAPGGEGGYNVTVSGVVVDQTVAIGAGRNAWIQDGAWGIQIRGMFGDDFRDLSDVGDEVLFAGNVDHFNGQLQVFNRSANAYTGLLGNNGPAVIPAPNVLDFTTATALDYEAAEGSVVRLENVAFVDAGGTFGSSAANYVIVNGGDLIDVRIQGEVASMFDGETIPSGALIIEGILGQWDNSDPRNENFQMYPRSMEDLEVYTAVEDWTLF